MVLLTFCDFGLRHRLHFKSELRRNHKTHFYFIACCCRLIFQVTAPMLSRVTWAFLKLLVWKLRQYAISLVMFVDLVTATAHEALLSHRPTHIQGAGHVTGTDRASQCGACAQRYQQISSSSSSSSLPPLVCWQLMLPTTALRRKIPGRQPRTCSKTWKLSVLPIAVWRHGRR